MPDLLSHLQKNRHQLLLEGRKMRNNYIYSTSSKNATLSEALMLKHYMFKQHRHFEHVTAKLNIL